MFVRFVGRVKKGSHPKNEPEPIFPPEIPYIESVPIRGKVVVWILGQKIPGAKMPLGADLDATPHDQQLTLFLVDSQGTQVGTYEKSKLRAGFITTWVTVVYWPQREIAGSHALYTTAGPPETRVFDPKKKHEQGQFITGSDQGRYVGILKEWIRGLPRS